MLGGIFDALLSFEGSIRSLTTPRVPISLSLAFGIMQAACFRTRDNSNEGSSEAQELFTIVNFPYITNKTHFDTSSYIPLNFRGLFFDLKFQTLVYS